MMDMQNLLDERESIERAGKLHWYHWFVVVASLILTVIAWYYTTLKIKEKEAARFKHAAEQTVDLVTERMSRYEDALWSGVANIQTLNQDEDVNDWKTFADALRIESRYPGINGIGVIHHLLPEDVASYLAKQQEIRPEYAIYPGHTEDEFFPISYVEPVSTNAKAVGLDIAHETNRYTAAKKARDNGTAQITGPIFLVQDAEKTPGFLFYAPYYKSSGLATITDRQVAFSGMVYAPFVVKKLMEGTLEKSRRHVAIVIQDSQELLYSEHNVDDSDFDPDPLFKTQFDVDFYGRTWRFDVWSDLTFRNAAVSNQPLFILIGGFGIDALLLTLFLLISRSNKRAVDFAGRMSESYQVKADDLEKAIAVLAESNRELDQFAYIASHDLQEPLRMVSSFTQLIEEEYSDKFDEQGLKYLEYVTSSSTRMQSMINDLLDYSRVDKMALQNQQVDLERILISVKESLTGIFVDSKTRLEITSLPTVRSNPAQITRVIQNLISNAIKYRHPERISVIEVTAKEESGEWIVAIQDNGIGIKQDYLTQIFTIFKRLHSKKEFPGTGLGLAICKKVIESMDGRIWAESEFGVGSTFYFSLPK